MSRHSALKSVFWLTFSEILFNLSGYIIHAVAGRTLGPSDYGRYSIIITLTTVIVVLIGNGIPTAMSRYLSEAFEKKPEQVLSIRKQGIRLQFFLMLGVTILFFLSAPFLAWSLNDPTLTPLFRLSSLIVPAFAAASFYFSYFTGLHLFQYQSILKSFRSVMRVTLIVGLVLVFGLKGAIVGYILAPLITFLLGIYYDRKVFAKEFAHIETSREFPAKKLLFYAWPITLFMLFYEIFISADLYLIKAILRDDTATGVYNAALTIGRIPYYLFYALAIFLLPSLAKIKAEKNTKELSSLMTSALRWSGIILIPTCVLISIYALPITKLFFGNSYLAAAPILSILVFGLGLMTVFYLICSALNGIGNAKLSTRLAFIGTLFSILLNYYCISKFGLIGAAYATTVSAFITTLITFFIFQQHIPITYNFKHIALTLCISALVFTPLTYFPLTHWYFIPVSIIASALYGFILYVSGIINKNDIPKKKEELS